MIERKIQMPKLILSADDFNQVRARVRVRFETKNSETIAPEAAIRFEIYEVGWDRRKPSSPLAITSTFLRRTGSGDDLGCDCTLSLGTPFYWTDETHYCYAAVTTIEGGDGPLVYESFFGLLSDRITIHGEIQLIERPTAGGPSNLPSLFVVSDSTAYSNGPNQLGWGDVLGSYFDLRKVSILNRARPGRSTRSFRREGLWDRALAEMKAGDLVLIQFGQNDVDRLDQGRCRGVLPGVGEEKVEVGQPDSSRESVHTFGWYLRQMLAEVKVRGATPILLTPTAKNEWQGERLTRPQNPCAAWSVEVAEASGVHLIDATTRIADRYDMLGQDTVQALFCSTTDNVHTSPAGADVNAACIADGLRSCLGTKLPFKETTPSLPAQS